MSGSSAHTAARSRHLWSKAAAGSGGGSSSNNDNSSGGFREEQRRRRRHSCVQREVRRIPQNERAVLCWLAGKATTHSARELFSRESPCARLAKPTCMSTSLSHVGSSTFGGGGSASSVAACMCQQKKIPAQLLKTLFPLWPISISAALGRNLLHQK